MKQSVKDSAPENWSEDGNWATCSHNDCHFFKRKKGEKRRLLARIYPDRVVLRCDSCKEKTTYFFDKSRQYKDMTDEEKNKWIPLKSLLDLKEWDKQ